MWWIMSCDCNGGGCDKFFTITSWPFKNHGSWSQVQSGLFVREKVGFRLLCTLYGMEKAHRASMLEDFVTARYDFMVQVQRIVRYISSMLSIA